MDSTALKLVPPITEGVAQKAVHVTSKKFLLSENLDVLLIGGGSLLLWALMKVMLSATSAPANDIRWWVFNLSFIANFPHFLVSYQLLYSDHRQHITRSFRFFWAAVLAPILLLAVLGAGLMLQNKQLWSYLATSLYFFVGWHYVKQIFGGIIVSNAIKKFYLSPAEKLALKWNLFSLWAISFLTPNIGEAQFNQDGIPYASLNLPLWTLNYFAYPSLVLSGMGLSAVLLRKFIREGRWPSAPAISCFLSIYVWYLPSLSHPMFAHTIPFFHSLQYLMFVYVFRRNKVSSKAESFETPRGRAQYLSGVYGYLALAMVSGACFMYFVPTRIDSIQTLNKDVFGLTPAFFAFTLFINIHHYFIDHVIWRGDNPDLREHLFQS